MSALAFDPLAYAKKLKSAGFTEQQAEVQAEILAEVISDQLATKKDIEELKLQMGRDLKELEYRLTIRLGMMMVTSVAVIATLVKIL